MVKGSIILGNRYEVLSKIGAGGMADVYKGRDTMLNRYVAIKVLKKEYREDETFVKKFISEAQAAAGLLNPNIVNVYDVGEDRGLYYMVMELVEGITLKDYIHKKGRLSTREVISITIQMCTGIAAAHSHKIIHRDIKPQNIIISKEGKVKVTDFGIAKAISSNTVTSSAMGSVHYVSPEQARGGYCDEKSDIYSVGITMYEMVTGEVPFDGDSTVAIAMKHLQEKITPPSELVPDMSYALEDIILKCTQKSSERRYANIALLITDLKKALTDPDGNFVEFEPVGTDGATVMFTDKDLDKIKKGKIRDYENDDYDDDYDGYDDRDEYDDQAYDDHDDYDDYDHDDYDDYDHDDDEDNSHSDKKSGKDRNTGVDPRMNKMMKMLTIVAAVIILFVAIFFAGSAIGVFKIGDSDTNQGEVSKEEEVKKDIEVPSLVGQTQQVAEEMCHKKGLSLEVVEKKNSSYADGTIIEQKIDAGEMVAKNTVIQVVLSSGAEEKVIPDVTGMTEDEAMEELKNNGFTKRSHRSEYSDKYEAGEVVGTEPGIGEKVTVDTEIVIIVSKGVEKKEVPSIEGKTAEEAKKALEAAGFKDGGATEEYDDTVKEGLVISQSVKAGKKVDSGSTITYVISKGPEPVEQVAVPPVSGSTLVEAKQALKNVGLENAVEYVDSPLEAGIVVETDPYVGEIVDVGTVIKLKVSNGSLANIEDPEEDDSKQDQNQNDDTASNTDNTANTNDAVDTDATVKNDDSTNAGE